MMKIVKKNFHQATFRTSAVVEIAHLLVLSRAAVKAANRAVARAEASGPSVMTAVAQLTLVQPCLRASSLLNCQRRSRSQQHRMTRKIEI